MRMQQPWSSFFGALGYLRRNRRQRMAAQSRRRDVRRQLRFDSLEQRVVLNADPIAVDDDYGVAADVWQSTADYGPNFANDTDSDGDVLGGRFDVNPQQNIYLAAGESYIWNYVATDGHGGNDLARVSLTGDGSANLYTTPFAYVERTAANEQQGNVTVNVRLSHVSTQTITVDWQTSSGTATEGQDYSSTNWREGYTAYESVWRESGHAVYDNVWHDTSGYVIQPVFHSEGRWTTQNTWHDGYYNWENVLHPETTTTEQVTHPGYSQWEWVTHPEYTTYEPTTHAAYSQYEWVTHPEYTAIEPVYHPEYFDENDQTTHPEYWADEPVTHPATTTYEWVDHPEYTTMDPVVHPATTTYELVNYPEYTTMEPVVHPAYTAWENVWHDGYWGPEPVWENTYYADEPVWQTSGYYSNDQVGWVDTSGYVMDWVWHPGAYVNSGTLTFQPGEIDKQLTFQITADSADEGDESFNIALTNCSNVNLQSWSSGSVAILDDDHIFAPLAHAEAYSVTEDGVLEVSAQEGVLRRTLDFQGESFIAVLQQGPQHGSLTLNSDGSFRYVPAANFAQTDSFIFAVQDASGNLSAPAAVMLIVNPVDDAPVAVDDNIQVAADTAKSIAESDLTDNDIEVDGDPKTVVGLHGHPMHGSVTWNADGSFTYTPNAGYIGVDSFQYDLTDGIRESRATVRLEIGPLVTTAAGSVALATTEETALELKLTRNRVQGELVTHFRLSSSQGSITSGGESIAPDAAMSYSDLADGFTFTPSMDFFGAAVLTVQAGVLDGDGSFIAVGSAQLFSVAVANVNDVPVLGTASADRSVAAEGMLTLNSADLLGSFDAADHDGDPLAVELNLGESAYGRLTLLGDGTYQFEALSAGQDARSITISDGQGGTVVATLFFNVTPAPNHNPTLGTVNYIYNAVPGTPVTFTAANVLSWAGAADIDSGDTLTLNLSGGAGTCGTLTDNGDDTYSYQADVVGDDTFSFTVTDGNGGSVGGTLTFNIAAANQAPQVNAQAAFYMPAIYYTDTDNDGVLVSELLIYSDPIGAYTDADSNAQQGIAVTGADISLGDWQYSLDGGTTWNVLADSSVTPGETSARLLAADSQTRVRLMPAVEAFAAVTLTFRGWDQSSGTNGSSANIDATGGTTAYSADAGTAYLTVVPPPVFDVSSATVNESDGTATVHVTLDGIVLRTMTVQYDTMPGTAGTNDFAGISGTLTFAPGDYSKDLVIAIADDSIPEDDEWFTVALNGATGGALIGGDESSGVVTIKDDDLVTVSVTAVDGSEDGANPKFRVSLSQASSGTVTVDFVTQNGTATAFDDYAALGGHVIFAPGETEVDIEVDVNDDRKREGNETVYGVLSSPNRAVLGSSTAAATIYDSAPPTVSITGTSSLEENAGTIQYTVTLSKPWYENFTVTYAGEVTSDPNLYPASSGDYTISGTTLTFAPGETEQTFSVTIVNDATQEEAEVFDLVVTGPDQNWQQNELTRLSVTIGQSDHDGDPDQDDGCDCDPNDYTIIDNSWDDMLESYGPDPSWVDDPNDDYDYPETVFLGWDHYRYWDIVKDYTCPDIQDEAVGSGGEWIDFHPGTVSSNEPSPEGYAVIDSVQFIGLNADGTVDENVGTLTLRVHVYAHGVSPQMPTFTYYTQDSTGNGYAIAGQDYTAISPTTVTLSAGNYDIPLTITNDHKPEVTEQLTLIAGGVAYLVAIKDDDKVDLDTDQGTEQNEEKKPGRYLALDNNDDNHNYIVDYKESPTWQDVQARPNEYAPLTLKLADGTSIQAAAADLQNMKLKLSGSGAPLKFWMRGTGDAMVEIPNLTVWTIGTDTIPDTIYVQGVVLGNAAGGMNAGSGGGADVKLELTDANGAAVSDDTVHLTVLAVFAQVWDGQASFTGSTPNEPAIGYRKGYDEVAYAQQFNNPAFAEESARDLAEEYIGAFTVVNWNDTDGDGKTDGYRPGEDSSKADTNGGLATAAGVNEVDLIPLRITSHMKVGDVPLNEKVKVTFTLAAGITGQVSDYVRLWKSSLKMPGEEISLTNGAFEFDLKDILMTDSKKSYKSLWVEIVNKAAAPRYILAEVDMLGHKDRVALTGVWFDSSAPSGNGPDIKHDRGDLMWSDAPDTPIVKAWEMDKRFGIPLSTDAKEYTYNWVGVRFASGISTLGSLPVNIDVGRALEKKYEYLDNTGWHPMNRDMTLGPLADKVNDNKQEGSRLNIPNNQGAVFAFDSPGPTTDEARSDMKEVRQRVNAQDFVRVTFGQKPAPKGNTIDVPLGSRASDFVKWHSQVTLVPDLNKPTEVRGGIQYYEQKRKNVGPDGAENPDNEIMSVTDFSQYPQ